jgi:hypothetical protein
MLISISIWGTGIALNLFQQDINLYAKGGDAKMLNAFDNFDIIGLTIALISLIRVAVG